MIKVIKKYLMRKQVYLNVKKTKLMVVRGTRETKKDTKKNG